MEEEFLPAIPVDDATQMDCKFRTLLRAARTLLRRYLELIAPLLIFEEKTALQTRS